MIGKILIGGLVLAVGSGAYFGWRLARGERWLPDFGVAASSGSEPAQPVELARDDGPTFRRGLNSAEPTQPIQIESPESTRVRTIVPAQEDGVASFTPPDANAPASPASSEADEIARWTQSVHEGVPASAEQLEHAIEALRDDQVRGNAMAALGLLHASGSRSLRPLERALQSGDEQQRTLAACAYVSTEGHLSTPEVARILAGLLTQGAGESYTEITPRPWIARVGRANLDEKRCAFDALCTQAQLFQHVEAQLEQHLEGPTGAARFDAAFVIVQHAKARSRAQAFAVLVDHLADNQLADDAAQAMRQLARAPDEALPLIRAALPGRDEQQSRLLKHFLASFEPQNRAANRLEPRLLSSMGFFCGDMLADTIDGR